MKATYEVEIGDLEYDTGYGTTQATLICDVEVESATDIRATIKDGEWFLINQDGGVFKHVRYECCSHDKELERTAIEMFKKAQAK